MTAGLGGGGPSVWIYGAGRTGLAVARLAVARGAALAGIWNRRPPEGALAALAKGLPLVVAPTAAPSPADLWLLTVSDDAIFELAESLAAGLATRAASRPIAAAHCAGALPSAADLAPLRAAGVACGSWHPAMAFRGAESDADALARACVAIEGEDAARSVLASFCEALGLEWHPVATDHKARYHSALVLASNGRVALDAAAHSLLADAELDAATARRVLASLIAGTEQNLRASEPADALTGPVARGDVETVRATLESLRDRPEIERLYRALAVVALSLVPVSARGDGHRALAALIETEDADRC